MKVNEWYLKKLKSRDYKEQEGFMKKIFVVYRENDLYKKIIPRLIEWLKDHEVEVIAFPSSASKDEIRIEVNMHLAVLRNNIVISDETCQFIIDSEDEKINPSEYASNFRRIPKKNPVLFTKTLDFLCDRAIKITYGFIFEKGRNNATDENSCIAEVISNLIEKIKNHGTTPKKIHVITEYTGDHLPFSYWENGIEDNPDCRRKYEKETVAPIIARWFAEKFESSVEIVSALKNKELDLSTLKTINAFGNWIIMDRHFASTMNHFGFNYKRFFSQATVLRLPIFDFFEDVYENKILEIADELLASEKSLKKLIKEEANKY